MNRSRQRYDLSFLEVIPLKKKAVQNTEDTTLRHCSEPSDAEILSLRIAQNDPSYISDHAAREIRQGTHYKS